MFDCLGKQKKEKNEDWKDYTCDICGEEFATKHGLIRHRSIHFRPPMPPKSFVCPQCGLAFDTLRGLNGHKVVHKRGNTGSSSKSSGLGRDFDLNQPPPNY